MPSSPPFFDNPFVMVNNASVLALYLDPDCIYDLMVEFLHLLFTRVKNIFIFVSPQISHKTDPQQIFAE